jgi:hypothetical protein
MDARRLSTDHLVLFSATAQHVLVELEDAEKLGRLVAATVPESWPPAGSDEKDLRVVLDALQGKPAEIGWRRRYVVLRKGPAGRPTLVGHAGLGGRPKGGVTTVEVALLSEFDDDVLRAQAIGALVDFAMQDPDIERVDAKDGRDRALDRLPFADDDDGGGTRSISRSDWETRGPCLPRRLTPRPADAPIEGIPAVAREVFDRLVAEPLRDPADMRREVALYLEIIDNAARENPYVDNDLGRDIARVCDALLAAIGDDTPDHTRRQIQAAARYFVTEEDGDSDLVIGGLDEDAAVANAVAVHLGRRDLVSDML